MMGNAAKSKWLLNPNPGATADRRLFCLPFAGGSASLYWSLARELSAEVQVLPIELPGRAGRLREQPYWSMDRLIDDLVTELEPWFQRPFAILGQSMGALIAFELARRLESSGFEELRQIIVGGFPAPQFLMRRSRIAELPNDEFEIALKHRYGFVPPDDVRAYRSAISLMLPTLRADIALVEAYRFEHGEQLSVPICAFIGNNDPAVSMESVAGWRERTSDEFSLRVLPGDHYSVIKNSSFESFVRSEIRMWSSWGKG